MTNPRRRASQDLAAYDEQLRRQHAADIAVALGAVDTGDDFDPYEFLGELADRIAEHTQTIASLSARLDELRS